jgi:hypothetical protein
MPERDRIAEIKAPAAGGDSGSPLTGEKVAQPSMAKIEGILKIKRGAEAQLHSLPGIHAVGVGKKVVSGVRTDEMAIAVFVVNKKPLSELATDEIIPVEIAGIKTDVIEMPIPRECSANPSNLIPSISDDKHSVLFSGNTKPGDGLVVMVDFTITPARPGGANFAVTYETNGNDTLDTIAKNIAIQFNQGTPVTNVTAAPTLTSVVVNGNAGTAVALTKATVVAVDDAKYFKDWVRGGIQVQPGGEFQVGRIGTLGCVATTQPTTDAPQGKVVAITCHHVVDLVGRKSTNLTATVNNATLTLGTTPGDSNPVPAGTLLEIRFNSTPVAAAFYSVTDGETPTTIAHHIADAINGLALPTITANWPGATAVTITGLPFRPVILGPRQPDSDAKLKVSVKGQVIEFSGGVEDPRYGIFVNLHPGGTDVSFSVFLAPAEKTSLKDVADKIASAIANFQPATTRGKVTASRISDTQVRVDHVEVIECSVTSDIRVGQPDASFCSRCSPCCSHRIGVILDARLDVDVALIQLDADTNYKPEVEGIALIAGSSAPNEAMRVVKRGRSTRRSFGNVTHVGMSGTVDDKVRLFNNAFLIESENPDPFSSGGDSGAVILDASNNKIVGLLFAGSGISGFATPWDDINAAFPIGLNPAPPAPSGQPVDAVRKVPKSAAQLAAPQAKGLAELTAEDLHPRPGGSLGKRIEQVEQEITATAAGREYANLVRRHFPETHRLITANRRVGVAWQRNGGPQIVDEVMRMLQLCDRPLPREINGRPLVDCLMDIKAALARYGSPELATDLATFMPGLESFAGCNYKQLLEALGSPKDNGGAIGRLG